MYSIAAFLTHIHTWCQERRHKMYFSPVFVCKVQTTLFENKKMTATSFTQTVHSRIFLARFAGDMVSMMDRSAFQSIACFQFHPIANCALVQLDGETDAGFHKLFQNVQTRNMDYFHIHNCPIL
jgi:hypothetical protein